MPELPPNAPYQLRLSDWRGESTRGFTTLDIGKFFPISEYLDNMIDGSDSASTDRLIGLAESFDGAKTVNAHLKTDAQMVNVGEITSICTLDKRIYSFRDSCINAVPCSSFEQWSRANSTALSSAADVACFDDVNDSPVSWDFAFDAYYHSLANSVTPAEVGRFFRRLADHQLHDVFDEAALVSELDKNNTYSSFSGTFYDAWGGKDGGKYKVKSWIGIAWNWDQGVGDYTSLTHQFSVAAFTENWTTDDATGDALATAILDQAIDAAIAHLASKR